jgi:glycosyltransferase involved in cell wall biosynthesis
MKVVLLSHFSLPFSGIASWTTMMNYYLFDVNNQIDYVVCPDSELELKFSDRKKLNKLSLFDKIISKSDKTKRFNNYINQLRKILSEEKNIIIQIIDNIGLLKAVLKFIQATKNRKRIYIQFYFHGFSSFPNSESILNEVDELVLLSKSSYQSFKQNNRLLSTKVSINNNGVDGAIFKKIAKSDKALLRKNNNIDTDKIVFIWCSQDRKKKGLEILLSVWKQLLRDHNNMELLVIGTNKNIVIEGVRFLGPIPNNQLAKYYQLADFYLFPTLCHEGFGLSLVEALKCGLYCIASNNGSVAEVLNYGEYGKVIENPNLVEDWVSEIGLSIKDYIQNNKENPYNKNIPEHLYELKDWAKRYTEIINKAKEDFSIRLYI